MAQSDEASMYIDLKPGGIKSKKNDDYMTILDPYDGPPPVNKPAAAFKTIESTRYCYHPDTQDLLINKKCKSGKLTVVRASKNPNHIKAFYYEHVM